MIKTATLNIDSKTLEMVTIYWLDMNGWWRRLWRFIISLLISLILIALPIINLGKIEFYSPVVLYPFAFVTLVLYLASVFLTQKSRNRRALIGANIQLAEANKQLEEEKKKLAESNKHLEEANFILGKLCSLDPLTGLYNRQFLETAALKAVKEASRSNGYIFSVMLDINKLKDVNDTYGHAAGDEVIRTAASFLRRIFRDHDYIIRLGGDEFEAIGVTDSPKEFSDSLQEKITPFSVIIEGKELTLSFSYGCAFEKIKSSINIGNQSDSNLQTYATKLHQGICGSADAYMYAMKKK